MARKILDCLRSPFSIGGCEVSVSASLGASLYPQDGSDAETLDLAGAQLRCRDAYLGATRDGRSDPEVYERLWGVEASLFRLLERERLALLAARDSDTSRLVREAFTARRRAARLLAARVRIRSGWSGWG